MTANNSIGSATDGERDSKPPNRLRIQWDTARLDSGGTHTASMPTTVEPSPHASAPFGDHHPIAPPDSGGEVTPEPRQTVDETKTGRHVEPLRRPNSLPEANRTKVQPDSEANPVAVPALVTDLQRIIGKLELVTRILQDFDRLVHESLGILEPGASPGKSSAHGEGAGFLMTDNRRELLELIARRINQ